MVLVGGGKLNEWPVSSPGALAPNVGDQFMG
jgi:hypothetical protein